MPGVIRSMHRLTDPVSVYCDRFKQQVCSAPPILVWPHIKYRLVGLVVKAAASTAEDPGFESRLRQYFSGSTHTSDFHMYTLCLLLACIQETVPAHAFYQSDYHAVVLHISFTVHLGTVCQLYWTVLKVIFWTWSYRVNTVTGVREVSAVITLFSVTASHYTFMLVFVCLFVCLFLWRTLAVSALKADKWLIDPYQLQQAGAQQWVAIGVCCRIT